MASQTVNSTKQLCILYCRLPGVLTELKQYGDLEEEGVYRSLIKILIWNATLQKSVVCVFMCVCCECVCSWVYASEHIYICGHKRATTSVFLYHFLPYFRRQTLPETRVHRLTKSSCQQAPGRHLLLPPQHWITVTHTTPGCWGSELRLSCLKASALSTESSPKNNQILPNLNSLWWPGMDPGHLHPLQQHSESPPHQSWIIK